MDDSAQSLVSTASTRAGDRRWIKVWDAPVRLFHWSIVLLVATSYTTAEMGWIEWHFYAGYTILALVAFRILWGFIGSDTARFSKFVKGPKAAFAHLGHVLRRQREDGVGHNPAGAFMVVALLLLLLAQTLTGLCANDGMFEEAPLAGLVGSAWSDRLTIVHGFLFDLIAAAVTVHVAAVVLYAVLLKQDLVRPMVTGWMRLPESFTAPRLTSAWLALIPLAIAAVAVWAIVTFS